MSETGPPRVDGPLSKLFRDDMSPQEAQDRLGRKPSPRALLGEGNEEGDPEGDEAQGAANPNPDLLAALSRAAARQQRLVEPPLLYATVIGFREGAAPQDAAMSFGTAVRTTDASGTERTGRAVSEVDIEHHVLVVHDDGSAGWFSTKTDDESKPSIVALPHDDARVIVNLDGRHLELRAPEGFTIENGDTVALHKETMQIASVVGMRDIGDVATVNHVGEDDSCEVSVRGLPRIVSMGAFTGKVKNGGRVLLDSSLACIINLLPDVQPMEHRMTAPVSWDDIGGQDDAIAALQDAFADVTDDGLEGFYHSAESRGAVLSGPPGCGKTLLVRALITHLMQQYAGKRTPFTHLYFKGPELLASLVGKAEASLRTIHAACRKVHDEYGFWPALIWDECEALFKVRGSGISSDATDSIVNTQLVETDGVEGGSAPNFYLTNRVDLLDPALIREGRVDLILDIGRPDRKGVEEIFAIHLRNMPVGGGDTIQTLAATAAAELFDPKRSIYALTIGEKGSERTEHFTLGQIVSGAMVADIVKKAAHRARKDDRDNGTRNGILRAHVLAALDAKFRERLKFDYLDDLKRFRERIPDPVLKIEKQKQIQV